MKHAISLALAAALGSAGVALAAPVADAHPADRPAAQVAAIGQVHIVQAVPDDHVTVTVDGRAVRANATVGSILGPFDLSPGTHTIGFSSDGRAASTSQLTVAAGSNSDVVLHRPAAVGGAPVISKYTTPMTAIGPGRARVLIAHTATVAPADVTVDGKVVFSNIANGEYATADVAAGVHRVALYPTGVTTNPLLGPLKVDLKPRTVTMVYAVGNPKNKYMQIIAHVVPLRADGSVAPNTIDTGSAGLAAAVTVHPFDASTTDGERSSWPWAGLVAALAFAVSLPVLRLGRRRGRRVART